MVAKPKPVKTAPAKPAISKARTAAPKKTTAAASAAEKPSIAAPVAANVSHVAPVPRIAEVPAKPRLPANDKAAVAVAALKKKDLIDKVVATTGAKKALVRDIVEATLTVLGDALSRGAVLNLPPFGKAKVSRPSESGSGKAMTVKLRRVTPGGQGGEKAKQTLAQDQD